MRLPRRLQLRVGARDAQQARLGFRGQMIDRHLGFADQLGEVARVVRDPEIAHDAFAGLPVDAIGLDHAHRGAGTVGGAIDFDAHGGSLSHRAPKVKYDYLLGTT